MKGSSLITFLAVGIGGWWLYNNWASIAGANPAVAAGEVPPPAGQPAPLSGVASPITVAIPPPAAPVPAPSLLSPAALIAALKAAAVGDPALVNGTMNQDQWNYYRNTIAPPALTAVQLNTAYPASAGSQTLTADQFVNQLHSVGLAAYRRPRPVGRTMNYRRVA